MAEEKNSGTPEQPAASDKSDQASGAKPDQPSGGTPAGGGSESTSTGLDPKIAALLAYLFGWVGGLVLFLIEKDNKDVRFHALQSILFSAAVIVIFIGYAVVGGILAFAGLSIISMLLYPLLLLGFFVIWIVLMIKGYGGERWKLPVIGDIAERNA